MSAEVSELREALRDALDRRGVLRGLKAQLRAEVFSTLEDGDDVRPSLPHENLLINELIREYLAFNNYGHTLSVFLPEAGQPVEPLRRDFLQGQMRLPEVEHRARGRRRPGPAAALLALRGRRPTARAHRRRRREGGRRAAALAARARPAGADGFRVLKTADYDASSGPSSAPPSGAAARPPPRSTLSPSGSSSSISTTRGPGSRA